MLTTPPAEEPSFASKIPSQPGKPSRLRVVLGSARQASTSLVESAPRTSSSTTSMPRTSHLTGAKMKLDSFLSSLATSAISDLTRILRAPLPLSSTNLLTRRTWSMDTTVLRVLSSPSMELQKSMESSLKVRSSMSERLSKRMTAKMSSTRSTWNSKAPTKDASFTFDTLLRSALSKNWETSSRPMETLRDSDSSLPEMLQRDHLPMCSSRHHSKLTMQSRGSTIPSLERVSYQLSTSGSKREPIWQRKLCMTRKIIPSHGMIWKMTARLQRTIPSALAPTCPSLSQKRSWASMKTFRKLSFPSWDASPQFETPPLVW